MVAVRASSLRVSWGRLLLDSLILVLGFGTFFWFFVISPAAAASEEEFARFVLTQVYIALDCLMLMAIGVLLMNATSCPLRKTTLVLLTGGFGMMFLADIVWATSVVTDTYLPGKISRTSSTSRATPSSPARPRCRSATSRGRNAEVAPAAAR